MSIAGVLGQCTTLTHLDLSGNAIGDAGVESLGGVLAQYRELVHLDLSRITLEQTGQSGLQYWDSVQ